MLYVGYVLEKRLDVSAAIDNAETSDRYTQVRIRVCVIPLSYFEDTICVSLYAYTRRAWRHSQRMCYVLSTYIERY